MADFNQWAPSGKEGICRLCNYKKESWLHLLCCCPTLNTPRRSFLKPVYLKKDIHSCQEASSLCSSHTDRRTLSVWQICPEALRPTSTPTTFAQKLITEYFSVILRPPATPPPPPPGGISIRTLSFLLAVQRSGMLLDFYTLKHRP